MPRIASPPSLLSLLTLPFLVLALALAAALIGLNQRAAEASIESTARHAFEAALQRIGDEIERQHAVADTLLSTALPPGTKLSDDLARDPDVLRQHLANAGQLFHKDRFRVSWVSLSGQSLSVTRTAADRVAQDAQLHASTGVEAARQPDWFIESLRSGKPMWTSVQVDPMTTALSVVRVRQVRDEQGRLIGTLAAAVSLQALQDLLADLKLPQQSVAFVVERNGQLIATGAGPVLRQADDGALQRLTVAESNSEVQKAAFALALPLLGGSSLAQPGKLTPPDDHPLSPLGSFAYISHGETLNWSVIVAAPRASFLAGMQTALARSIAISLLAVALILLLGAWVKRHLTRDALEVSRTLQAIADGDLETPPAAMHSAELESLGESLRRTQLRLRNDRITGLANRETVLNRLHDRMRAARRHRDAPLMAILFVDLNRFRAVNQQHGHEAGDFVLQTIGRHLRQTVRETDLVARWAGDEFVVLLDGVGSIENAERVREQVERVLRDPVELGPGRDAVELDGTVGMSVTPVGGNSPDALLRAAEADMLQRKPDLVSSSD